MKKILSFSLLAILLFSCVSMVPDTRSKMLRKGITTESDDFYGETTTRLNLPMGTLKLMAEVSLGFEYAKGADSEQLSMYTYIYHSQWLFAEKVAFNIDGVIYDFNSVRDFRDVLSQGYVQEQNFYPVELDFLSILSGGTDVKIRISGSEYYMDIDYKHEFDALIDEYIETISD